jgi:hypothetical protein
VVCLCGGDEFTERLRLTSHADSRAEKQIVGYVCANAKCGLQFDADGELPEPVSRAEQAERDAHERRAALVAQRQAGTF